MSISSLIGNYASMLPLVNLVEEAKRKAGFSLTSYAQEVAELAVSANAVSNVVSNIASSEVVGNSTVVKGSSSNTAPSTVETGVMKDFIVTQTQALAQEVSQLPTTTNSASSGSATASSGVDNSDLTAFLSKVRAGTVTNADLMQMQTYAQGVSGLSIITQIATSASEEDSTLVDFSDIKVFFGKVHAGTVTDSDLAQMQEQLYHFDTQDGSKQTNDDDMNNPHKTIFASMIHAYSAFNENAATQDLKA